MIEIVDKSPVKVILIETFMMATKKIITYHAD